ncbi:MAG: hypothetical protein FWD25_11010 [Clostridia bacterium]|nr:hypothetical protein [Clostridia bacterium]
MNKFLNMVIRKTSWKTASLFTVLFIVLFVLINYSGIGVSGLLRITGGANILDFELGYTQEKAYDMLTALGTEGRAFYLTKIMPLDFPFPLAYMLFYVGWIALLLQQAATKAWCKHLLFVPVLAMVFDWIENIGIITMLRHYPNLPSWAVVTASTFGLLKMAFVGGSLAVMLALFVFRLRTVPKA